MFRHPTKRSITSRQSRASEAARLSASASASAVSSVQAPGVSSKGPPPTMSTNRGCSSRGENSSVVPTASPTASPRKAPSARFRMLSIVLDGSVDACGTHPSTWASCAGVSMAPGPRASRTRRTASSGRMPSSTSNRAAMVPARPRPPPAMNQYVEARSESVTHGLARVPPGGLEDGSRWRPIRDRQMPPLHGTDSRPRCRDRAPTSGRIPDPRSG